MKVPDKVYAFFAKYTYENSGIVYEPKDYYRLDARIKKLMKELSLETPEDLLKKFQGHVSKELHDTFIDVGTNNETSFFRDKKPFKVLNDTVIPEILDKKISKRLKIWSAACSFGQEVYSILMSIEQKSPGTLYSIDGSDISTEAVAYAKEAKYDSLQVQRGMPVQLLMKYFDQQEEESWKVKDLYKRKCSFKNLNLIKDPFPPNAYDIIFCRNVLIYFDVESKEKIINKLYSSLTEGGYLFLGIGESLIKIKSDFKQKVVDGTPLFYKNSKEE